MEIAKAKNWYWWLWLSPFLTFPTLVFLVLLDPGLRLSVKAWSPCNVDLAEGATILLAVLGASLWHLLLLNPALDKESAFVRWHGRQMMMLAGIQAAVPLAFGLLFGLDLEILGALLIMPIFWFIGNLWGHLQAGQGKCSLLVEDF